MRLHEAEERWNASINLLLESCNASGKNNSLVTEGAPWDCDLKTFWFKDANIVRFIQKNNYPQLHWFQTLVLQVMWFILASW